MRLVVRWWAARRLCSRGVSPVSDEIEAMARRLAARLRVSRTVSVLRSTTVFVPSVVGWFKPVILLPAATLAGLSTYDVEAILAHELAHIRRHDYLVNLLQHLAEALLFFHPAVWWISRRIRIEREYCCDDLAVEASGSRLDYSRALAVLERLRGTSATPSAALPLAADGGSLLARIQRLAGATPKTPRRLTLVPLLVVAAIIMPLAIPESSPSQVEKDSGRYVTLQLVDSDRQPLTTGTAWLEADGLRYAQERSLSAMIDEIGRGKFKIGPLLADENILYHVQLIAPGLHLESQGAILDDSEALVEVVMSEPESLRRGAAPDGEQALWRAQLVDGRTGSPLVDFPVTLELDRPRDRGDEDGQMVPLRSDEDGWLSYLPEGEISQIHVGDDAWLPSRLRCGYSWKRLLHGSHLNAAAGIVRKWKPSTFKFWKGDTVTGKMLLPGGAPASGEKVGLIAEVKGGWHDEYTFSDFGTEDEVVGGEWGFVVSGGGMKSRWFKQVVVDAEGRFVVTLPPQDRIGSLRVSCDSEHGARLKTAPLARKSGDLGTFEIETGVRLQGKVVDLEGEPMAGVTLKASNLTYGITDRPPQVRSGEDGRFDFGRLPSIDHQLTIEAIDLSFPFANDGGSDLAKLRTGESRTRAIFLTRTVDLPVGKKIVEVVVEPISHQELVFESSLIPRWRDGIRVTGNLPGYGAWSRSAEGRRRDGKEFLVVAVPVALEQVVLNVSDSTMAGMLALYHDLHGVRDDKTIRVGDLATFKPGRIEFVTAHLMTLHLVDVEGNDVAGAHITATAKSPRGERVAGPFRERKGGRYASYYFYPDEEITVHATSIGDEVLDEVRTFPASEEKRRTLRIEMGAGGSEQ
ncbi:MAG: hypothetical protein ACI9NC_005586 [Verrucomicrobiales bacterium]